MAAKPAAGGAGAGSKPKKELDEAAITFLTDRINAEINSQIGFGAAWGDLVPGAPRSIEEAIDKKKAEIEELRKKLASVAGPAVAKDALATTSRAQFIDAVRPSPEAGFTRRRASSK